MKRFSQRAGVGQKRPMISPFLAAHHLLYLMTGSFLHVFRTTKDALHLMSQDHTVDPPPVVRTSSFLCHH